jgi:3-hydroxybutyryl-CoA dehydrogenase
MGQVVAVLGGGTMGRGIARCLAGHVPVRVYDASDEVRQALTSEWADAPVLGVDVAADVEEAVTGASVVLESVSEELETKVAVLSAVREATGPDVTVGTNTSSLDLTVLGDRAGIPDRLVGVHWFNPPEVVPGVEVAAPERVDAVHVRRVTELLRLIDKVPLPVGATPGYVANRLHEALLAEAIRCVTDGAATAQQVDAVVRSTFGPRFAVAGPFEVMDQTGLVVQREAFANLEASLSSPAFRVPPVLDSLISEGRTGLSAGAGFYQYEQDATEVVAERVARLQAVLAVCTPSTQEEARP